MDRTIPILTVALLLAGACGGSSQPAEEPADTVDEGGGEGGGTAGEGDGTAGEGDGSGSSGAGSAGRPPTPGPDGVPMDCPFMVDDLCYDAAEDACAAAGCAPDACDVLESYPAQVSCR